MTTPNASAKLTPPGVEILAWSEDLVHLRDRDGFVVLWFSAELVARETKRTVRFASAHLKRLVALGLMIETPSPEGTKTLYCAPEICILASYPVALRMPRSDTRH